MGSLFRRTARPSQPSPGSASGGGSSLTPSAPSRVGGVEAAPLLAPEVDLKGKLPPEVADRIEPLILGGGRALLLDPEEEETRYFGVFEDRLEELGRSPVSEHAGRLERLDFCAGGAIQVAQDRYRLELFKSFNEFGDRLTVQFFREAAAEVDRLLEARQRNIRLVNQLKPATSLTAANERDLARVVERNPRPRGFVDLLLEEGLLTPEQVARVPEGQRSVLRILQSHIFPRKVAAKALATYLEVEYLDVEEVTFSKRAARLLEEAWSLENQVVPFQIDGEALRVAMMDPTDQALIEEIQARTGLSVRPCCSAAQDIVAMIRRAHRGDV